MKPGDLVEVCISKSFWAQRMAAALKVPDEYIWAAEDMQWKIGVLLEKGMLYKVHVPNEGTFDMLPKNVREVSNQIK
jgi:hypothetical protein